MAQFRRVSPSAASWYSQGTSSAATELTVTKAAVTAQKHYITGITVSAVGAAVGNDKLVTLKDGTTAVQTWIIPARDTNLAVDFGSPIQLTVGTAANLVVDAGAASVITSATLLGYTA